MRCIACVHVYAKGKERAWYCAVTADKGFATTMLPYNGDRKHMYKIYDETTRTRQCFKVNGSVKAKNHSRRNTFSVE